LTNKMLKFSKYQALGNDYIVIEPSCTQLSTKLIKYFCDRNYGIGSNGVLYGPLKSDKADYKLQIFNPDGSEAEISGNGLRIFAQYLKDQLIQITNSFTIETKSGVVNILYDDTEIIINMGKVAFPSSTRILEIDGVKYNYVKVDLGNPHCVILDQLFDKKTVQQLGKKIENNSLFPNKTNVQFLRIKNRNEIEIEIWERGAGYTLASGSSSIASAAVAYKLGVCDNNIIVNMPGGQLYIKFDEIFNAFMRGKAHKVFEGQI